MEKTNHEFKIQLNLKTYRDFNFYHFYKNFKSKLFLLCIPLIVIGLPILSYYYVKTSDIIVLLILVTDLVLAIFLFVLLPVSILINTKLFFSNDSFLQENQTYIINKDEISVKTKSSEASMKWKSILKVVETKNYFFIYQTKVKAYIIPKNQISNELSIFFKDINKG